MKFSFVLGEKEYVEAMRMSHRRSPSFRIIAFAILLLVSILVVQSTLVPVWIASLTSPDGIGSWASLSWLIMWTTFKHCGYIGILGLCLFGYGPWIALPRSLRKRYRNNPNFQVQMEVEISEEGIVVNTASPSFTKDSWRCIRSWREGKRVLTLTHLWGTMHMINISGLTDMECEELRRILRAALPQKK